MLTCNITSLFICWLGPCIINLNLSTIRPTHIQWYLNMICCDVPWLNLSVSKLCLCVGGLRCWYTFLLLLLPSSSSFKFFSEQSSHTTSHFATFSFSCEIAPKRRSSFRCREADRRECVVIKELTKCKRNINLFFYRCWILLRISDLSL